MNALQTSKMPLPLDTISADCWGDAKGTAGIVAMALHAIATKARSANAMHNEPTSSEYNHVRYMMAVYIEAGLYEWAPSWLWAGKPVSVDGPYVVLRNRLLRNTYGLITDDL